MNKVLVILATYNGEKYVKEQIHSILNQIDVDVSLIVYDDKSDDNTLNIINAFSDARIKVVQNKVNSGSSAKNFIRALLNLESNFIKGFNYISLSDQDDIWLDSKLIKAITTMQIDDSSLYASNLIIWDEYKGNKHILKKDFKQTKYDFLFEGASAGCTYVLTSLFLLEFRKFACEINFDKWKFLSHDWLIYFFARLNHFKVVIDKNAYILYRIHETNVHGQLNTYSFYAIKERLILIREGWYFKQAEGFMSLLKLNTNEYKIYKLYSKNYFTRLYIIFRHNFTLIRSPMKAIQFFLISLLPLRIKK
jgi:rhamnosyltransferase